MPVNLVFAGTPAFAVPALEALAKAGHRLRAVYTQPDRPAGRGRRIRESAVKLAALRLGVPIHQPVRFDTVVERELRALAPDALIVVAYGQLLSPAVLTIPQFGGINVHASLLPRWRGAAPIARAIEAGDRVTGISIMQMEAGLDTGPVWATAETAITDTDTASTLHDRLSVLGARLLVDTLTCLARGDIAAQTQDNAHACYANKLRGEEAWLDWNQPAEALHRRIRAFLPQPVAYTLFHGRRLRLWGVEALDPAPTTATPGTVIAIDSEAVRVATGDGALALARMQLEGGKVLSAREFANGQRLAVGDRFDEARRATPG